MTREQAEEIIAFYPEWYHFTENESRAFKMAFKALKAWDKFKQALDKRILEQGFDEDEWSISYNELIKMMKKCGVVE